MPKDRLDIISQNWDKIFGLYYFCNVYLGWILFLPWRDVHQETVITGVSTSGSHSEHQFVCQHWNTLEHFLKMDLHLERGLVAWTKTATISWRCPMNQWSFFKTSSVYCSQRSQECNRQQQQSTSNLWSHMQHNFRTEQGCLEWNFCCNTDNSFTDTSWPRHLAST